MVVMALVGAKVESQALQVWCAPGRAQGEHKSSSPDGVCAHRHGAYHDKRARAQKFAHVKHTLVGLGVWFGREKNDVLCIYIHLDFDTGVSIR